MDIKVDSDSKLFVIIGIIIIFVILVLIVLAVLFIKPSETSDGIVTCNTLPFPYGITVLPQGLSQIKVSWNPVAQAFRYRVYIGTIPGFTPANAFTSEITETNEIVIGGLVAGREYYVLVETINECNNPGPLSPQRSTIIGFPTNFKIVNRLNSNLMITEAGLGGTELNVDCQLGMSPDNDCVWIYNTNSKTISPSVDPNTCLISQPGLVPGDEDLLKVGLCTNFAQNIKQWEYNEDSGSLCHPLPSGGFKCIKSLVSPGEVPTLRPYTDSPQMQWDIIGAIPL